MEKWDAYREDKSKTGELFYRGQDIPQGRYHLVVEILVIHEDGDLLFMKRDYHKAGNPGLWEASAGGAVLAGENSEEGALRELAEETGITSITAMEQWQSIAVEDYRTIFDNYIVKTDCAKDSISLQEGETIDYRWVAPEQLEKFIAEEPIIPNQIPLIRCFIPDEN